MFKNIELRNIYGKGAKTAVELKGLPEQGLENITPENINLTAYNFVICSNVESIALNNVKIQKEHKNDTII
ncbi:MAG: hypothetical protein LUF27_16265 [Lachnospiraceae bacterium]|nr:hypothetical protein [Lachnospiraceae bacterium]